jgi:predicted dehydrogenase
MDGVLISTPHTLHFPQISQALERGLHVLSEKPLVVRSDHARRLIELRDRKRRVLLVAYQRHYQSSYRHLHKAVGDGRLGRLNMIVGHQSENWLAANAGRWRTDPALSGGGVMADVMSHILEALLWITDLRAEEVYARFDNRGTAVEVIAALSIRFAGGAIASITTGGDTRRARFHEEINLWGDRGAVELIWEGGAAITEWMPEKRVVPESEWPPASSPARNFVNAVLGKEQVEVPAEWGLKVTLLKEAAWESGRTGRAVKLAAV